MYLKLVLLLVVLNFVLGEFQLRVLHTNDVHARVEQTNVHSGSCTRKQARSGRCYGGVARRQSAVSALRDGHENVILLDAGDQFQGTPWYSYYKGAEAAHFMNQLGYDVMALGNHEFDDGVSGLLSPFLERVTFPVVCCNLNTTRDPELRDHVTNYTVLNVSGQLVGVIGYITTDTSFLVNPDGIENITFLDPISCIQTAVEDLQDQGIDKIIALGHSGFEYSKKVAGQVNGVDIVIDGHTNTFLYNGRRPSVERPKGPYPVVIGHENGTNTLVYQAYAYGKYLGCADVTFDDAGNVIKWEGNPVLLDNRWREDEELLAEVMLWKKPLLKQTHFVIADTLVYLEGGHICEEVECNSGVLITDVMLRRGRVASGWPNVSIAFINGGSIRAPIQKGPITLGDLQTMIPIPNRLVLVSLTGSTLKKILEHSVSSEMSSQGHFLQMAGMRVWYDLCMPEGHRVADVTILCSTCNVSRYEPLASDVIYHVVTTDYIMTGGDGYSMLRDNILESDDLGIALITIIEEDLTEKALIIEGVRRRINFVRDGEDCDPEISD